MSRGLAAGQVVDRDREVLAPASSLIPGVTSNAGEGRDYPVRHLQSGQIELLRLLELPSLLPQQQQLELLEHGARLHQELEPVPQLARLRRFGTGPMGPYVVLEQLSGETLAQRMRRDPPLGAAELLELLVPAAEALAQAHASQTWHHQLSPYKVLLRPDGQIRVLDLALLRASAVEPELLARLRDGRQEARDMGWLAGLGVPGYMAPEQWAGEGDGRADVFALGAMIFRALCGRTPHGREPLDPGEPRELVEPSSSSRSADLPAFSGALAQVARRALSWDPGQRPESMEQLAHELQQIRRRMLGLESPGGEPYRFLESFDEQTACWFFGRDAEARQLQLQLQRDPLVCLYGAAGAGKSSLIGAGLLPRLRGMEPSFASVLQIVVGAEPCEQLARQLSQLTGEQLGAAELLEGQAGRAGQLLCAAARGRGAVLLVLDQVEQLETLEPAVARRFLSLLWSAVEHGPDELRLLLALRDDSLPALARLHPQLFSAVRMLSLGRPDDHAMEQMLLGPASLRGYRAEHGLVREVVHQLRAEPAPLPLLQVVATKLWERRDRSQKLLRSEALHELGPLPEVLARHADRVMERLATSEEQRLVRSLACALVSPDGQSRPQPRQLLLSRHAESQQGAVQQVLQRLVQNHMISQDSQGQLRLVHASLIQRWARLRGWLAEERTRRQRQQWIQAATRDWEAGHPARWSGPALSPGDPLYALLSRPQQKFVAACRQRRRRLRLLLGAALVLLAVVAAGAVTAALSWRRQSQQLSQQLEQSIPMGASVVAAADRRGTARLGLQQRSTKLLAHLCKSRPATPKARRSCATGLLSQGQQALAAGAPGQARQHLDAAQSALRKLLQQHPRDAAVKRNLAVVHNKLGDVARAGRDLSAARANYRKAVELAGELVQQVPDSAVFSRDLSVSYNKLGDVARADGDLTAAGQAYRRAMDIRRALLRQNPGNATLLRDLSVSYNKLGDVARAGRNLAAAGEAYARSVAITRKLVQRSPGAAAPRKYLAISLLRAAVVAGEQEGQQKQAAEHLQAVRQVLDGLRQAGLLQDDPQIKTLHQTLERMEDPKQGAQKAN